MRPAAQLTDERFTDRAFAEYRQEHGISDGRRLGDMPLQVMSEVMQKAQKMKALESYRKSLASSIIEKMENR